MTQTRVNLAPCESALQLLSREPQARAGLRIARLQSALAILHARKHEPGPARELMNRALAVAAEDLIVKVNNGNLLLREGAFRQALDVYSGVLDEMLSAADAGTNYTAPVAAGVPPAQPPAEGALFTEAVLYRNRSLALRALGRYAEARQDYLLYRQMMGLADYPT